MLHTVLRLGIRPPIIPRLSYRGSVGRGRCLGRWLRIIGDLAYCAWPSGRMVITKINSRTRDTGAPGLGNENGRGCGKRIWPGVHRMPPSYRMLGGCRSTEYASVRSSTEGNMGCTGCVTLGERLSRASGHRECHGPCGIGLGRCDGLVK